MTGANVPQVSLQRTFTILLILYCVALVVSLLAGGALLAHSDPFGECLLYAYQDQFGKLFYGSEYTCKGIGGLFVVIMFCAICMIYVTFKHRRELITYYNSGEFTKGDKALTISNSVIWSHATITCLAVCLTIAITAGYQVACSNIEEKLSGVLRAKINKDPNLTRGEKIDERFTDDNQFWRYTGKIGNPFGSEIHEVRITCRTIFTDPNVHQELHDNHVELFSTYFGYWYKQDLFAYNSQLQSVLTNSLIEATMAGAWLSVLVWVGSLVFMIIQKYYIKREKWAGDKVSLHSGVVGDGSFRAGSMRKYEGSMISGYQGSGFYGNTSMSRPGTASGMGTLGRGSGLRGSMDNLALTLAGATPRDNAANTQAAPSSYPGYPQQFDQQFGAPAQQYQPQVQQQFMAPPTHQYQPQMQQQQQQFRAPPVQQYQYQQQQPLQAQQSYVDTSEMETEIM